MDCFLTCSHGNRHAVIQLAREVYAASCQAAGCEMSRQGCLAFLCGEAQGRQLSQQRGPFRPSFRVALSRMLLLTLAGDATGGRTGAWSATRLEVEICCCSTGDCYRQDSPFLLILRQKIIQCLLPVIHLLKCLCQFSGERNKITRTRLAQWEKTAPRGSGAGRENETLSLLYRSCRALACQIIKTIKEKCLLWEKRCKTDTLLHLDRLPHIGRQMLQNNSDNILLVRLISPKYPWSG